MTTLAAILVSAAAILLATVIGVAGQFRKRNLHRWLGSFCAQETKRRLSRTPRIGPVDVLLCIADHFEPHWGGATEAVADDRVGAWTRDYPALFGGFRDSDGRAPRHTFFYPIDQYEPRHVEALAALCRCGYGEVEIHLHHDHDTACDLEATLRRFTALFAERHGVLGRWTPESGGDGSAIAFGFVHGNWALDNSRRDGRWCGVANELDVLNRTGCYADFTFPSAPDETQPRTINSIYYAAGRAGQVKSHDRGVHAGCGPRPPGSLMLIQGPLRLWWPAGARTPRIENGCIQGGQPPSPARLDQWIRAGIGVPARPGWRFVKLHTHGATERNRPVLLGEPMIALHRELAARAARDPAFRFHYVTAREMFNLARAAEAGWQGTVAEALNFAVGPPSPRTVPGVNACAEYPELPESAALPGR